MFVYLCIKIKFIEDIRILIDGRYAKGMGIDVTGLGIDVTTSGIDVTRSGSE
jgi:hypothetical protein